MLEEGCFNIWKESLKRTTLEFQCLVLDSHLHNLSIHNSSSNWRRKGPSKEHGLLNLNEEAKSAKINRSMH